MKHITRTSEITRSARVLQLEGMFDVSKAATSVVEWDVDLPLHEHEWQIGLIVGPSGSGKSTIAREFFERDLVAGFEWDAKRSIVDCFPDEMTLKDITLLLSSVGFSSPPSWLRPFNVLSNGEQFRATLARAMAESGDLFVFDEFTSVVDRTVARIGSAAIAKTIRRSTKKFIAVTCHYDIEEWLDPDWIYDPSTNVFAWRLARRRPPIELDIVRVPHSYWKIFAPHHYLTASINKSATCFCAFIDGKPVAFTAWLTFFGRLRYGKARRGHRLVCLPDYQGVGIGNVLFETIGAMWCALGYRVFTGTGHPAEINNRLRSPNWRLTKRPSTTARGNHGIDRSRASDRLLTTFEWVGRPMDAELARNLFGT